MNLIFWIIAFAVGQAVATKPTDWQYASQLAPHLSDGDLVECGYIFGSWYVYIGKRYGYGDHLVKKDGVEHKLNELGSRCRIHNLDSIAYPDPIEQILRTANSDAGKKLISPYWYPEGKTFATWSRYGPKVTKDLQDEAYGQYKYGIETLMKIGGGIRFFKWLEDSNVAESIRTFFKELSIAKFGFMG